MVIGSNAGMPGVDGEGLVAPALPTPDIERLPGLPDGVSMLHLYWTARVKEHVVAVVESHPSADLTPLALPSTPLR
ncbi:MAG: hypothetical protein ACYDD0_10465 [Candidatus Dormibacteria bacterium]